MRGNERIRVIFVFPYQHPTPQSAGRFSYTVEICCLALRCYHLQGVLLYVLNSSTTHYIVVCYLFLSHSSYFSSK